MLLLRTRIQLFVSSLQSFSHNIAIPPKLFSLLTKLFTHPAPAAIFFAIHTYLVVVPKNLSTFFFILHSKNLPPVFSPAACISLKPFAMEKIAVINCPLCNRRVISYDLVLLQKSCLLQPSSLQQTGPFVWSGSFANILSLGAVLFAKDRPFPMI